MSERRISTPVYMLANTMIELSCHNSEVVLDLPWRIKLEKEMEESRNRCLALIEENTNARKAFSRYEESTGAITIAELDHMFFSGFTAALKLFGERKLAYELDHYFSELGEIKGN